MYKILIVLLLTLQSCVAQNNNKTDKKLVDTEEFSKGIESSSIQLLDVRTPGEYSQGHIPDAVNYDWLGNDFKEQIKNLDKSQPVYVYCQSGRRSAQAADKLISEGFEVYELKGGMLNWRSKNLPESTESEVQTTGMSMQDYNDLLKGDQMVLVDFYADWCAPCKKMEPFLKSISEDMSKEVKVVRIDVETHKKLANDLKISAIPILKLYKDESMIWEQNGFIGESELRANISKFSSAK